MKTLKDKSYKLFENGNIQKEVIETKDVKEKILEFKNRIGKNNIFSSDEINLLVLSLFGDWEEPKNNNCKFCSLSLLLHHGDGSCPAGSEQFGGRR